MEENVKKLVDLLNEVRSFSGTTDEKGRRYAIPDDEGNFDAADEFACKVLIDEMGYPIYEAHLELEKYGFRVLPGDVDSFGWLTGVIVYPNNELILVFG